MWYIHWCIRIVLLKKTDSENTAERYQLWHRLSGLELLLKLRRVLGRINLFTSLKSIDFKFHFLLRGFVTNFYNLS